MTSVSSRPVARLSGPGDIVATIPSLCGFLPHESIVVLSLRGPRKRLGLTIRLDLPPPAAEADAAELLAERVVGDGGAAAVVVVYGAARRPALVDAVGECCEAQGVEVTEALHVADGRWSSYVCSAPCCPQEGTELPPVPPLVEAQQALDGRAVLTSRSDLVAALAPPSFLRAQQCAQACDAAMAAQLQLRDDVGEAAARTSALQRARAALDAVAHGTQLDDRACAAVAVALQDVRVRDEVATWSLKRSDALLSLAEQVARATPPPYDPPVCTLLAWIAYARGDGARANVALDRALASDPSYSLALLLRQALDGALPPKQVRGLLRQTRSALRTG